MRLHKFSIAAALGGALSIASSAQAQAPAASSPSEDLRCFVVTSLLAASDDESAKQIGQMGALYFMGRIDAKLSDKKIEDQMVALSAGLTEADTRAMLVRCGGELEKRGATMQEISKRVQVREEAAAAAKK
ncbi:hypothetical protein SGCZBJ_18515 [Caulobacter zeae]|uniref:Uncharacterized protein n=1 Tax=Caulobacter zeae TaxID=2055137 RepID=A0A2N5D8D6_9CAUL|nr:hypothetical protein [Caulobacter zeae]PLR22337.1 hypothetical protein SGCZBJ_18515 [Caulobacter zeae]